MKKDKKVNKNKKSHEIWIENQEKEKKIEIIWKMI